jgi:hypothetical protein
LVGNTLSDPRQQPLQLKITCGTDLFIQHHDSCKPLPQHVGFVMLVPLFDSERFSFVPGEIAAGDQETPFLHWPKLSEVSKKQDYWNPTEVLRAATKDAQLLVHSVQCSCA